MMLDRSTVQGLYRAVLAETEDVEYAEKVKLKAWTQQIDRKIAADAAAKRQAQ